MTTNVNCMEQLNRANAAAVIPHGLARPNSLLLSKIEVPLHSMGRPDWQYISRMPFIARLFMLTLFASNSGECLSNVGVDAFRVSE